MLPMTENLAKVQGPCLSGPPKCVINGQCRRLKRCLFSPWFGKIPLRKAWQPTPVFLPGESSLPPGDLPNPGIKPQSPALQADSLPAEPPGKALQLTSYSNLNGRSSPWYWSNSTYSFFLWDGQNLLFDVSQLPSPASIMISWCFLLLSSQIPKES